MSDKWRLRQLLAYDVRELRRFDPSANVWTMVARRLWMSDPHWALLAVILGGRSENEALRVGPFNAWHKPGVWS